MKGVLYLIPTTLGDSDPFAVLPPATISVLQTLDYLIVEQIRTARRLLSRLHLAFRINGIQFFELNKHTSSMDIRSFLSPALDGKNIGLLSEAGTPCIADPGAVVVGLAHELKIKVVPLTGPSSLLLALMASGFNGQSFAFHGYLPIVVSERQQVVRQLEKQVDSIGTTQLFIETPFRNRSLFETLMLVCQPETLLCIAADLSLETEFIQTMTIKEWKKKPPEIQKRPAVFLLGKRQS